MSCEPVSEVFAGVEVDRWSSLPLSAQPPCSAFAAADSIDQRIVFSQIQLLCYTICDAGDMAGK